MRPTIIAFVNVFGFKQQNLHCVEDGTEERIMEALVLQMLDQLPQI